MLSSISCCADSVCTVLVFKSIRHPDHMKQVAAAETPSIFHGEGPDEKVESLEFALDLQEEPTASVPFSLYWQEQQNGQTPGIPNQAQSPLAF